MTKLEILQYINDSDRLNGETLIRLKNLVQEYPYFQTAHLLLAKNRYLINPEEFEKNLPQVSALCADRTRFFYFINNEKYGRFFPKEKSLENIDRTEALLSSYFDNFSEEPPEITPVESSIISTDYLTYLQSLENAGEEEISVNEHNGFKHQNIIDNFLEKADANEIMFTPAKDEPQKPREPDTEPEGQGFLTETLAKIYIKQKKYEQALTIIRQLSLNFPKKSAYFADQIRFLELLILNEKNKKQ
ncbi:MAG: hypothetical protein Q4G48_01505 [Bacteroidia bacterium]|nr:hypothetical protein [Bacteroidia bacterium]